MGIRTFLGKPPAAVEEWIRAEKALPYDAEVEYLESTGTQWIDTGLKGCNGYDFEYSFRPLSPLPCAIGGVYQVQSSCYIGLVRSNGMLAYNYFAPDTIVEVQTMTPGTDYDVSAHLFSGSQYFDVNGVRGGVGNRSGTFESNGTMYVFAINSPSMLYSYMRLYRLKIYYNNSLIRDFVPVRVGMEGAMMDRLTRKIYRNAGTGAFKFGADRKETPLMCNSYVKDGLVAMWDGVENAGWGGA